MIGGTLLEKHSYPEAFARAASMAFDKAFSNVSPIVVERWSGFILKVDPNAGSETLETLATMLGEVPASISFDFFKQRFIIDAQGPAWPLFTCDTLQPTLVRENSNFGR